MVLLKSGKRKNDIVHGVLVLCGMLSCAGAGTAARAQAPAVPAPVAAPATAGDQYDVERAVREALATSYALAEARRTAQISEERANELAAQGRPNVTGSAYATR